MTDYADFAKIKVGENQKCYSYKCDSSPLEMPFYLTEWELVTGASTDGLVYCERCVREHMS